MGAPAAPGTMACAAEGRSYPLEAITPELDRIE